MRKILKNWGFLTIHPPQGRYAPPEQFRTGFSGVLDGREVELPLDSASGGNFVSGGIEYELGDPDPIYEDMFPDALKRTRALLQRLSDAQTALSSLAV